MALTNSQPQTETSPIQMKPELSEVITSTIGGVRVQELHLPQPTEVHPEFLGRVTHPLLDDRILLCHSWYDPLANQRRDD